MGRTEHKSSGPLMNCKKQVVQINRKRKVHTTNNGAKIAEKVMQTTCATTRTYTCANSMVHSLPMLRDAKPMSQTPYFLASLFCLQDA